MGLAPTRELAGEIVDRLGPAGLKMSWALSGCPNCCAQPQLAAAGIIVSRLVGGKDGGKEPRFDLYRRTGPDLGTKVREQLTFNELTALLRQDVFDLTP
jgi:ferredoxin-nitrite reductase